jgi:hypothetical protein
MSQPDYSSPPGRPIIFCHLLNTLILVLLAASLFLVPATIVIHDLTDPNIRTGAIPDAAWKLFPALAQKYARWARGRIASGRAERLSTSDIAGTEWPLFGSVFFLQAVESLQDAWETNHALASVPPKESARAAIEAATDLVIDPGQAGWVKKHWGESYLKRENAFYRMLIISALTSQARLTGSTQHLEMLRDQVESLSADIDASSRGLLEDYPGECYPGDVLMAVAMIRKADPILGTDHSAFTARAIRGFQNEALDLYGLVPYTANVNFANRRDMSRGCGNSYVSLFAPAIWPEQAVKWYDVYAEHFWQETNGMAGFREFPRDMQGGDWYFDVDSGPVFKGFGIAACAFGTGAARVNGRLDHAYPLTAELYATSWPLPDRTLLVPRLLSNAADAPYLGEAAILFILTRTPIGGVPVKMGGAIPGGVMIGIGTQLVLGLVFVWLIIRSLNRWWKNRSSLIVVMPRAQFGVWLGLLVGSLGLFLADQAMFAMISLLLAQLLPRYRQRASPIGSTCLPSSPPPN